MSKLSFGGLDERVAGVDDPAAGPHRSRRTPPSSVTVVSQAVLVDRLDGLERWVSRVWVGIGVRVSSSGDLRLVARGTARRRSAAGARRTARPPRSGCRPRRACRPGSCRSPSRSEVDVDAVVGELELLDLADADAAVGHLTAGEDAAGVGEVRDHGVGVVEDTAGRAGRTSRPTKLTPTRVISAKIISWTLVRRVITATPPSRGRAGTRGRGRRPRTAGPSSGPRAPPVSRWSGRSRLGAGRGSTASGAAGRRRRCHAALPPGAGPGPG